MIIHSAQPSEELRRAPDRRRCGRLRIGAEQFAAWHFVVSARRAHPRHGVEVAKDRFAVGRLRVAARASAPEHARLSAAVTSAVAVESSAAAGRRMRTPSSTRRPEPRAQRRCLRIRPGRIVRPRWCPVERRDPPSRPHPHPPRVWQPERLPQPLWPAQASTVVDACCASAATSPTDRARRCRAGSASGSRRRRRRRSCDDREQPGRRVEPEPGADERARHARRRSRSAFVRAGQRAGPRRSRRRDRSAARSRGTRRARRRAATVGNASSTISSADEPAAEAEHDGNTDRSMALALRP